ncbi:MAG: tetratricopeptide repeat protein [Sulfuricurvum sp.]|nr:tetratricopeptide repeat protein [Sulfuricurvum sp.]
MFKKSKWFMILVIVGALAFADNVPTVHQIYQTAQSGDLNKAHSMVQAVLKVHPESAKAHYVNAEILVREGNINEAKSELELAQKLSPDMSFAKPQSIHALEERLAGKNINNAGFPLAQTKDKPFPWMMLILGVGALLFIVMIVRSISSRNAYVAGSNSNMPSSNAYPNNGFAPYTAPSGGIGSNIASGLAAGAAAGVGMVAAEELMHHFMDDSSNTSSTFSNDDIQPSNDDMGGVDFGVSDSSSWDDLSTSGGDDTW